MMEYFISKLTFTDDGNWIDNVCVWDYDGNELSNDQERVRKWMVEQMSYGKAISTLVKDEEGDWIRGNQFEYENGYFSWGRSLPKNITKRKAFISYYHKDDQFYRDMFEKKFGDLVVNKSVDEGDIDSDNCDDYIKQLIQREYLADSTVIIVFVGPKTKCRKHVDWEISGSLNKKVGDSYAGLLGILLPTHPDFGKDTYVAANLPARLAANVKSGYALLKDWSDDRVQMQNWIEEAFSKRSESDKIVNKYLRQMTQNSCE
jgi:hypothetical protein